MSKKASEHPDEVFTALARVALVEVTAEGTFSEQAQVSRGDDVVTVSYASTEPGYPGWRWTLSVSHVPGVDPSVLEVQLLPGEGSLVSPEWVPWADRLEEYLLHEKELKDTEIDDEDDDDTIDLDDDVDGVDIDQLDLDLDPGPLEVPSEPDDLFDHVELDEPDPLDP
jgi:hypothetical protein